MYQQWQNEIEPNFSCILYLSIQTIGPIACPANFIKTTAIVQQIVLH